jgi:tetratricopeptide (TPR) repeat protein
MYAQSGANLDEALKLAQTAKQGLQNSPEIDDTLGWVYYKKDLGSLAVRAFADAVQKDARNPVYHYHLGLAYLLAQDRPNGRASLERALAISKDFDGASDAREKLSH